MLLYRAFITAVYIVFVVLSLMQLNCKQRGAAQ